MLNKQVAGITSIFFKNVLSIYHLGSLKLVMVFAAVLHLNYKWLDSSSYFFRIVSFSVNSYLYQ